MGSTAHAQDGATHGGALRGYADGGHVGAGRPPGPETTGRARVRRAGETAGNVGRNMMELPSFTSTNQSSDLAPSDKINLYRHPSHQTHTADPLSSSPGLPCQYSLSQPDQCAK
jgi:hypothetical protein